MSDTLVNAGAILIAALIGLVGLGFVNWRDRQQRSRERSKFAFSRLMSAVGNNASANAEWLTQPRVVGRDENGLIVYTEQFDRDIETGGPSDIELQTIADITIMESVAKDRAMANKLANLLFQFKRALTTYRVAKFGELVGDIRKWSTSELTEAQFMEKWDAILVGIDDAETERFTRLG